MAVDSGLSAAGSSTYASNTLHVGDGTWDSERDTFLLPNLMGINFDTMRYNGKSAYSSTLRKIAYICQEWETDSRICPSTIPS